VLSCRSDAEEPRCGCSRQVSELWVSYHNTSAGAMFVTLSLPHVLGMDTRPWILAEHALVVSTGAGGQTDPTADVPADAAAGGSLARSDTLSRGMRPHSAAMAPSFLTLQYSAAPGMLHQKLQVCVASACSTRWHERGAGRNVWGWTRACWSALHLHRELFAGAGRRLPPCL
jgi:hypothetical protein